MIAFASGIRVWLATGHTDMRKGFDTLALVASGDAEARSARGRSLCFPRTQG